VKNEHLKRSRKQEKRGAELYGGSRNAGSGNKGRKNDVRTDEWSIEFKTTKSASYSLKHSELQIAERNAILEHRSALFGIDFARGAGGTSRYVVVTEHDLLTLLQARELLRDELEEAQDRLLDLQVELDFAWSLNSE
jgi:hypothetical protein